MVSDLWVFSFAGVVAGSSFGSLAQCRCTMNLRMKALSCP